MDRDAEVLDAEPPERRHPPRWLVLVVALVVLAGATGWYVDQRTRAREAAALAGCRRELLHAVITSDRQLMAAASGLSPILARTSGRRHHTLVATMSLPARRLLPGVAAADRQCRGVSIRPWHAALRARRAAITAYSSALIVRLRSIAADGSVYYQDGAVLRRLRRAADIGVPGGRY